jgi:hypothetical protein
VCVRYTFLGDSLRERSLDADAFFSAAHAPNVGGMEVTPADGHCSRDFLGRVLGSDLCRLGRLIEKS